MMREKKRIITMHSWVTIATVAVAVLYAVNSLQSHVVVTGFVYPRTEKSLVCCTNRIPTSSITTTIHYNPSVTDVGKQRNNLKFQLASRPNNDDGPRPPKSSIFAKIRTWARKVTGISISSIISRRRSKETVEKSKETRKDEFRFQEQSSLDGRSLVSKVVDDGTISTEEAQIAEKKRVETEGVVAAKFALPVLSEEDRKAELRFVALLQRIAAEEAKIAAEKDAVEKNRIAEEKQKEEERMAKNRAEAERAVAAKVARISEESRKAKKIFVHEKAEEEQRIIAEETKRAAEKVSAEQARIADAKRKEEERIAAEAAENARIAEEKQKEEERIAIEAAEQARIAMEKREEEERVATEEARITEEKRIEEKQIAMEAAETRITEEKRKDGGRIALEPSEKVRRAEEEARNAEITLEEEDRALAAARMAFLNEKKTSELLLKKLELQETNDKKTSELKKLELPRRSRRKNSEQLSKLQERLELQRRTEKEEEQTAMEVAEKARVAEEKRKVEEQIFIEASEKAGISELKLKEEEQKELKSIEEATTSAAIDETKEGTAETSRNEEKSLEAEGAETASTEKALVEGWREAVRTAEQENKGEMWPIHVTESGQIRLTFPVGDDENSLLQGEFMEFVETDEVKDASVRKEINNKLEEVVVLDKLYEETRDDIRAALVEVEETIADEQPARSHQ